MPDCPTASWAIRVVLLFRRGLPTPPDRSDWIARHRASGSMSTSRTRSIAVGPRPGPSPPGAAARRAISRRRRCRSRCPTGSSAGHRSWRSKARDHVWTARSRSTRFAPQCRDDAPSASAIAAGQGFWGDWLEAPVRQVRGGPIDYLVLDYLAEVTMSILQKQRSRATRRRVRPRFRHADGADPARHRRARGIRVISNAGGVNPRACARGGARGRPRDSGSATGSGSASSPATTSWTASTRSSPTARRSPDMETGRPLADIRDQVRSANAYLGMAPVVEALARGANVVITGRVTDTGLTLGPIVHEFGWSPTTGTGSRPAPSPATSSSAARRAPAATCSRTGAT